MNKLATSAVLILILAGGGVFLYKNSKDGKEAVVREATEPKEQEQEIEQEIDLSGSASAPALKAEGFIMADVAKHANPGNCWAAINGGVYDLTAWIGSHPGGEDKIIALCGKDGSATFNGKHGGSEKQETQLAAFKIGVLTK